jgi:N-glycosylase/DNA lyase
MEKSGLRVLHGALRISKQELNLMSCLRGGMSFRWRLLSCDEQTGECEFVGVMNRQIMKLRQQSSLISYSAYLNASSKCAGDDDHDHDHNNDNAKQRIEDELSDYFRLDEPLDELYAEWSKRDPIFCKRVHAMPHALAGIRVLRLDPVETLFSFICSSNNNIKRITQMVENMCKTLGDYIGVADGLKYFAFPSIDRLAGDNVEATLRALQFGYRAKYIHQAAVYLKSNGRDEQWLYGLRKQPYEIVCQELVKIAGVGRKVILSCVVFFFYFRSIL